MFSSHFEIKLSKIGRMLLKLLKFKCRQIKKNTLYSDFLNYDDCFEKISSICTRNNLKLFETLIFGPLKMNFNVKTLDLCLHHLQ